MEKPEEPEKKPRHATRYFIVGISLAIFNFVFYTILANLIINNNDFLWVSTLISTLVTTILAYILHSKITWKERNVTKSSVYKFFIWNALLTFPIGPGLTQLFSLFTPAYELAYNIFQNIHIDFSYEFVQSTGTFVFTSFVIMVVNFTLYDRFVFGKTKKEEEK
ncbi:GtrA family protein [Candidatus Saccharibacteria bacterium]|nr:GtrA family protein [Candidatus Saccharibacteria bacterium]